MRSQSSLENTIVLVTKHRPLVVKNVLHAFLVGIVSQCLFEGESVNILGKFRLKHGALVMIKPSRQFSELLNFKPKNTDLMDNLQRILSKVDNEGKKTSIINRGEVKRSGDKIRENGERGSPRQHISKSKIAERTPYSKVSPRNRSRRP